jgi:hypothetical protein
MAGQFNPRTQKLVWPKHCPLHRPELRLHRVRQEANACEMAQWGLREIGWAVRSLIIQRHSRCRFLDE